MNAQLQQQLQRYTEGTLSEQEREQLAIDCGRDNVVLAATQRANRIQRRRRMACTLPIMAAIAAFAATPLFRSTDITQTPNIAAIQPTSSTPSTEQPLLDTPTTAEPSATAAPTATLVASARPHTTTTKTTATVATPTYSEPIVTCNNHCEADSVINDIWKFLSA